MGHRHQDPRLRVVSGVNPDRVRCQHNRVKVILSTAGVPHHLHQAVVRCWSPQPPLASKDDTVRRDRRPSSILFSQDINGDLWV